MAKKITMACLFVLGFASVANAEVWCMDGSSLEDHADGRCPAAEPEAPAEDPAAPAPGLSEGTRHEQECRQRADALESQAQSCFQNQREAERLCDWDKSFAAKRMKMRSDALAAQYKDATDASIKQTCTEVNTFFNDFTSTVGTYKNNCSQFSRSCATECAALDNDINEFSRQCDGALVAQLNANLDNAQALCTNVLPKKISAAEKSLADAKKQKTDAKKCAAGVDAQERVADATAEEPIAPKGADPARAAGAADNTKGDGGNNGGTTAGAEDTDDSDKDKDKKKDDKKKQANNNSNPLGALAGIAGALMNGAAAQNAATAAATPVAPMELASDDCRRPERANSDICFCSNPANVRSQRCMGGNSASYNSTFGNPLQGVGGAKLANPTTGPTLNLPSSIPDPGYIGAGNKDSGGGGGQGMLGGGGYGGLNPGNPNQKPDPPPAKAKSALSADILVGVRGGTNPFGPRGPSAPRPSRAYGTPRDPDELRGYNLKADNNPNLQRFLPNRGTAAEGPGQIAGSAAYGVGGIHTADKNIFNEMTNRYRALEDSLLP